MNPNSEAAEQVIRLSLEGFETTVKVTGSAAKHIAVLLFAILKEEQKTSGKARLSNMIKSGKELKVFSLRNQDLNKFVENAKRYGILYNVLKEKDSINPYDVVDIIARAEDAAKIDIIIERYSLAKIKNYEKENANPIEVQMNEKPPSAQSSEIAEDSDKGVHMTDSTDEKRPSVKQKLQEYKNSGTNVSEAERSKDSIGLSQKSGEVSR